MKQDWRDEVKKLLCEAAPAYLSIPQAAKLRGQHPRTLHVAVMRGQIAATIIAGRRYVTEADLAAFPVRKRGRPAKDKGIPLAVARAHVETGVQITRDTPGGVIIGRPRKAKP